MAPRFDFRQIMENIIGEINEAKRKSLAIHKAGNIGTSGDEVEDLVREKISLFLPEKYLVRQGHIINAAGQVSNQFDIIIFDRQNTPKFFEAKNNTVFYPIESVLAVGEIKKTLRANDLVDFGKKIKFLKVDMNRKLIDNTIYGGNLTNALLSDMIHLGLDAKYKNPLFSFVFAIDVKDPDDLEIDEEGKYMPNDVYIINHGYYITGEVQDNRIIPQTEDEGVTVKSLFAIKKSGVPCLAMMFSRLIHHLNKCHIDPFGLTDYIADPDIYGIFGVDVREYKLGKESTHGDDKQNKAAS